MASFLLVYQGGAMPETPEEGATVTEAWNAWFAQLGSAVVDGGNPASATRTISGDGSVRDEPNGPSGYSIIRADSLDAAVELARGCPVLAGSTSVQVVETFNAM